MNEDPIKEVRRIREEYSAEFNHDVKAIFADLRRREAKSSHKLLNLAKPAKRPASARK